MNSLPRRLLIVLSIAILIIAVDQYTKWLAQAYLVGREPISYWGDLFRLQYALNVGVMLSLGATLSPVMRFWFFTVGVGVFLVGLFMMALWKKDLSRLQLVALALVVGGGSSNLFDRIRYDGVVVDFMNAGIGTLRTGIFNVADMAIMAGIFVLIIAKSPSEKDASH